jgi:hypothetical protein
MDVTVVDAVHEEGISVGDFHDTHASMLYGLRFAFMRAIWEAI